MPIHKEGNKIVLLIFAVLVLTIVIINVFLPTQTFFHFFIYSASFVFLVFIIRFFRNPARPLQPDENLIYSPADGKIVVIDEVIENEYFNNKMLQVSVFMSPMNVHKNWYPVSGNISFSKHHPGRFLVAWHPKSSDLNERTSVVVDTKRYGEILIRQVAGAVAQRIICYAKKGQEVKQGEEMGFIKFGSRVDLFLPTSVQIDVSLNQKVKGNRTVIGRF